MERCVWAPHRHPGGMEREPKVSLSMRLGRDAIASSLAAVVVAVAVLDVTIVARTPGWKVEGANTCFIATRETTNK
jgi:hypothetical protein